VLRELVAQDIRKPREQLHGDGGASIWAWARSFPQAKIHYEPQSLVTKDAAWRRRSWGTAMKWRGKHMGGDFSERGKGASEGSWMTIWGRDGDRDGG
jgi:hypothetical protein